MDKNHSRQIRLIFNKIGISTLFMFATATAFAQSGSNMCVATTPPPVANGGDLAAYTTASGTWRVAKLGQGYLWTLDENPSWSSAMVCNTGPNTITATVDRWTLLVPTKACKFAQDEPPVSLNASWITQAIDAGRWLPYRASSANGFQASFGIEAWRPGSLAFIQQQTYDPASMNGTSNSDNIVGIISGSGGEYATSRGAIDDADAEVIARALQGENIEPFTNSLYNTAFASAGYPYRTPFNGDMLRDPQKPISGPQYSYQPTGNTTMEGVETIRPESTWRYDAAHLANSGWALWLGTEDPRIGFVVQSHAAFSLSVRPAGQRDTSGPGGRNPNYYCDTFQPRAAHNCLNAMWRARDVANRVNSGDTILWSAARVADMYEDTENQIMEMLDRVENVAANDFLGQALKNISSPFYSASCAEYEKSDGTTVNLASRSNFFDQQYGGVPAYLRAKDGEQLGARLMEALGKQMVARTLYLGGAAGIDGRHSNIGRSALPIGPCDNSNSATPLPFSDRQGWAQWVEAQNIVTRRSPSAESRTPPTDSLQYAQAHTTIQTSFIIRAAAALRDAGRISPIADLDAAITAFDAAKVATPTGSMDFAIWYKHTADIH